MARIFGSHSVYTAGSGQKVIHQLKRCSRQAECGTAHLVAKHVMLECLYCSMASRLLHGKRCDCISVRPKSQALKFLVVQAMPHTTLSHPPKEGAHDATSDSSDESGAGNIASPPQKASKATKQSASPIRKKEDRKAKRTDRSTSRSSSSRVRSRGRSRMNVRNPQSANRHLTVCWFGRDCSRKECWFKHPEGREVDERPKGKAGGKGIGLRRARTPSRCIRSPSRRSPSRSRSPLSASPKKAAPKRPQASPQKASTKVAKDSEDSRKEAKREKTSPVQQPMECQPLSFREYILQHGDGLEAHEALAAFQRYLDEVTQKELAFLKGTGLLFDMYNPVAQLRAYDSRLRCSQLNAQQFQQDMQHGCYKGLSLRASGNRCGAACSVAGHMQAPEFAFDPDLGSMLITGLPPAASAWDVFDAIQDCSGFVTATWALPSLKKEINRTFKARFLNTKQATSASMFVSKQSDTLLCAKGLTSGAPRVSTLTPSPELSASVLPPEMASKERLEKDLVLSAKVIHHLDDLLQIPEGVTSSVLDSKGSTEQKLDLQVIYLRRVHHFCFYAGEWFQDEWSLRDSCGVVAVRDHSQDATLQTSWSTSHEKRISDFLATADLARPQLVKSSDAEVCECFSGACQEQILQVAEEKFRCKLCSKCFKGPAFVRKHIIRIHLEMAERVRAEFHEEKAKKAFLSDSKRPGSFLHANSN